MREKKELTFEEYREAGGCWDSTTFTEFMKTLELE